MQYVTVDILKRSIGERLLSELSDADHSGDAPITEVLEQVNTEAVSELHSYLQGVYQLPIQNNKFIQTLIIDIMRIRLLMRRDAGDISETLQNQHKALQKTMQGLRSREIHMNVPLTDATGDDSGNSGDIRYQNVGTPKFNRGFARL